MQYTGYKRKLLGLLKGCDYYEPTNNFINLHALKFLDLVDYILYS